MARLMLQSRPIRGGSPHFFTVSALSGALCGVLFLTMAMFSASTALAAGAASADRNDSGRNHHRSTDSSSSDQHRQGAEQGDHSSNDADADNDGDSNGDADNDAGHDAGNDADNDGDGAADNDADNDAGNDADNDGDNEGTNDSDNDSNHGVNDSSGDNSSHNGSHTEDEFRASLPDSFDARDAFSSHDLNHDGSPDHFAVVSGMGQGSFAGNGVHVFSGATGKQMFSIAASGNADAFGFSVDDVGDVNGDGVSDLAVGAPANDAAGLDAGRAGLYSGVDGSLITTFLGSDPRGGFGFSMGSTGDLDGDGIGEVMVSAPFDGAGKVYVFLSSSTPLVSGALANTLNAAQADLVFAGENTGDAFGHAIANAGDVNGDGLPDLIIGAPLNDGATGNVNDNRGRAYLYSGANGALLKTITGSAASQFLGVSVSGAGDVDHNGADDVLVGAPDRPDVVGSGSALIFFSVPGQGSTPARLDASAADITLSSSAVGSSDSLFGGSVSQGADVNGDGTPDLIVGAASHDGSGALSDHRSYVFSGADASLLTTKVASTPADLTPTAGANAGFDQFRATLSHFGHQDSTFRDGDLNLDGVVNSIDVALAMDATRNETTVTPPVIIRRSRRSVNTQPAVNGRKALQQQLSMLPDVLQFLDGAPAAQANPTTPSTTAPTSRTNRTRRSRRRAALGGF